MTINEKAAYLKGLMEGLQLDTEKAEGKMIAAMVELLGDLSKKLTNVEDTTIAISDELDEIEEDLDAIEDYILDEEDDEDWDDEDEDDEDLWDDDEDYEAGFEYGDMVNVSICRDGEEVFKDRVLFHQSFGFAKKGDPMIYNNELMKVAMAVSQGSMCKKYDLWFGPEWTVVFTK